MLIERYRECPELAWGDYEILDAGHRAVLAHSCRLDGSTILVVHNLCDEPVDATLTLDGATELTELLRDGTVKVGEDIVEHGWLALVPPGASGLPIEAAADGVKFDDKWKDYDIVEAAVYAVAEAKPDSPVLLLADGTKRLTAFVPSDKEPAYGLLQRWAPREQNRDSFMTPRDLPWPTRTFRGRYP